jgi:sugar phosphate isomerase/epimerase
VDVYQLSMNRRSFIYYTSGLTVCLPSFARKSNTPYLDKIGLQLYTLRNPIKQDLSKTLTEVAQIGYKQVEPYGFPSPQALELIKQSRDLGMKVNSSHFDWNSLLAPEKKGVEPFEQILETANRLKLTDLVVPYLHEVDRADLSAYGRTADLLNKGASQAKQAGIRLAYHNHAFEFQPMSKGKTGYDVFVEDFSKDMFFEVDVFWLKVGGVDPVTMIRKLGRRISQLHLKDLKKGTPCPNYGKLQHDAFDEIGDGMIPMKPIMQAAQKAGVKHCHVEQDHSPAPLESIRKSLKHLNG